MKLICLDKEDYTFIIIESESEDGIFIVEELKNINPNSPCQRFNKGIVLSGRAPIWVYAALVHYFHPAAWVATYDPRLNSAVVVMSHTRGVSPGDILPVNASGVRYA